MTVCPNKQCTDCVLLMIIIYIKNIKNRKTIITECVRKILKLRVTLSQEIKGI